jgi:serine/threonine-protein phosphatase PGAM5
MRFLVKLAASTVGILCTTASAYLLIDEKKRYGVIFAATNVQSPSSVNSDDLSKSNQGSRSSPIRSSEQWNWNWDGNHANTNKTRALRHVYLIRHGQYQTKTKFDDQKQLTELGNEQADWTGRALTESKIQFTRLVQSGLIRAIQTTSIINKYLKFDKIEQDIDLNEGFPFLPEPAGRYPEEISKGRLELETERMERVFHRYMHRPSSTQTEDSHELIVCHANVIRYFVCRALQVPADTWLRFNLFHCSITHLVFTSDGRVICYGIGDVGHIPQERRSYV